MQVKYSLQTLNTDLPSGFQLDNRTFIADKKIIDLFKEKAASHWQSWIGSLKMDEIRNKKSFLVTWTPTSTPEVLDAENETLSRRLNDAWHTLLLVRHDFSERGSSQYFSGSASLKNEGVIPKDMRSYSERLVLQRSFYEGVREFYDDEDRLMAGDKKEGFVAEWKRIDGGLRAIHEQKRSNAAIYDAFESFLDGRTTSSPTTAIARLVEASEAIIGLPQNGGGRNVFAQRALLFLSDFLNDSFLKWSEEELRSQLVKIYEIRNHRNHGKGMRSQILEVYGICDDEDDAQKQVNLAGAKSLYLAENLAKETIKYIILNPESLAIAGDRSRLEESWARGEFYNQV